jgi:hypothetical protein
LLVVVLLSRLCLGGVTIITHGLNGNADDWITGMADEIPKYYRFFGTNFTTYKVTLTFDGSNFNYQWTRTNGSGPSLSASGEVIVKLDWSQMAGGSLLLGGSDRNTYDVAQVAAWVMLQTNSISDLGGHALAEFPIHLIGHSRGGSLVSEISRLLGTNGVWVDHLTTLDPHPLNNDGFSLDGLYGDVDAPVHTYQNVLFHDNYWQDLALLFYGESVSGAYVRQLHNLSGGYNQTALVAPYHSNVHLWYHGTIDWRVPASDGSASITASERSTWWVAAESQGANAGFYYSLIGGGDRLSADQPLGPGFPAIRDGYNQNWDLGAGTSPNRTALASNNGNWPNLIKLNRMDTNQVVQGQATSVKFFYQWAQPSTSSADVSFYLDDDFNPINTNQKLVKQLTVPGTGGSYVNYQTVSLTLDATNAAPGYHALFARINAGGRSRFLYAPELIQVAPAATRIVSTSGNLAFGNVNLGSTAQQTLTISNTGNATLTVSGLTFPTGFSGDWSTGTIPAGGSHAITVTFTPNSPGTYSGNVTITSDATGGTATIPVSGFGSTAGIILYTITLTAAPDAGGIVAGEGTFVAGGTNKVTAITMPGYTFANWTDQGTVVSTSTSYSFPLNGDRALVAHFIASQPGTYTVLVSSGPPGSGKTAGGGAFKPGVTRTVRATPGTGYIFANWTENGTIVSTSAAYTFSVNAGRYLVANFIPNPFIPLAGTYTGLFSETNGISQQHAGFFTVNVTSKGAFSGNLQIGGARLSTSGQFDATGNCTKLLKRGNTISLTVHFQLDLASTTNADRIGGSVGDAAGTWWAPLEGDRSVFNAKSRPAPQQGSYTMLIAGTNGSASLPAGDGYGTVSVDKAGKIRFAGSLADGTKVTQAGSVSKNGDWPFYLSLYGGQGSMLNWLTFAPTTTNDLAGSLVWIKPTSLKTKYYPAGFALNLPAWAFRYTPPARGSNVLPFNTANLLLIGGDAALNLTNQITIGANNRVNGPMGSKLSLTFTPASGLFKGTLLTSPGSKPVPFNGVVLQTTSIARGYFLGTSQSGKVLLTPAM